MGVGCKARQGRADVESGGLEMAWSVTFVFVFHLSAVDSFPSLYSAPNAGSGLLKNSAASVTHLPSNRPRELVL